MRLETQLQHVTRDVADRVSVCLARGASPRERSLCLDSRRGSKGMQGRGKG